MANESQSLQGKLILDNGTLRGSFFQRTVVLVCQHNSEGAFGLVLNRSTNNKVGDALVANIPDVLKEETLFLGGPVQPQALSYLHSDNFLPDANVMPNLSVGHSLETLLDIGESYSTTQKLKVFAGYAGWSPGQLDKELKENAWLIHPATFELVFSAQPEKLWQSILEKKGWKYRLISEAPEDISWN